jgi:hypothetical protein
LQAKITDTEQKIAVERASPPVKGDLILNSFFAVLDLKSWA